MHNPTSHGSWGSHATRCGRDAFDRRVLALRRTNQDVYVQDIGLPPVRFCGTKGGQGLIDTPPGVGGGSRILAANGQIGQFLAAEVILAAQAARLSSAAKDLNRQ